MSNLSVFNTDDYEISDDNHNQIEIQVDQSFELIDSEISIVNVSSDSDIAVVGGSKSDIEIVSTDLITVIGGEGGGGSSGPVDWDDVTNKPDVVVFPRPVGDTVKNSLDEAIEYISDLQDEIFEETKIAAGMERVAIVEGLPDLFGYTGSKIVYNLFDGKLYRLSNGEWVSAVPAVDIIGQLTSEQIADLEAAKIAGQLTSEQIEDIEAAKIVGQLVASQIADAAINVAKLASGIRPVEIFSSLPASGNTVGRTVYLTTDGKLYRWTGSAWTAAVAAVDVTGQLTNAQIADLAAAKVSGQLTNAQIADIAAAKITGALVSSQIADAAITTAKFASGLRPIEVVSTLPASGNVVGRTVVLTTDQKLYRWNGSAWTASVSAVDITGQLTNAQIADLAATKVSGQLTNAQISDIAAAKITGTVVASQIADAAITAAKFASGLRPVEIVSSLPGTPHIEGRTVYLTTDDKLYRNTGSGWVSSVAAADVSGQLTDAQLAGIAAAKLTGQVTGTQITDNAITTAKINAGAVVTASLAASAVTANEIASNAITTAKIAANAVTATQIAAGTITAAEIASNAITTSKIAAGAVSATELAAGSVTTAKLVVSDSQNLLLNGDFSYDLDDWSRALSSVTRVTGVSVPAGAPALSAVKLTRTTAEASLSQGAKTFDQDIDFKYGVPVNVGDEIYAECWVHSTVAGANTIMDCVVRRSDNGAPASTTVTAVYGSTTLAANAWTKVGKAFTVANDGRAYLRLRNDVNNSTMTITRVRFMRRNTGELIVDGSVIASKIAAGAVTTAKIDAGAVTANEIATNAITAVKISAGAVTAGKVAANAITANEISSNAITTAKIAANAVTATQIAAGTITAAEIASNAITTAKIAAGAVTATEVAANAIAARHLLIADWQNLIPDNQFQDASSWTSLSSATLNPIANVGFNSKGMISYNRSASATGYEQIVVGQSFGVEPGKSYRWVGQVENIGTSVIPTVLFRANWVGNDGIATGGYTDLGTGTIPASTGVQTFEREVTIPDGVTGVFLRVYVQRTGATFPLTFNFGGISCMRKAGGELIVDGAITAEKIVANAVTTAKIATGAVTANEIATNAITAVKISAGAVTTGKVAANAITANEIAANAVTTAKIAANAVTATQIAAGTITAAELASNSIVAGKIAAGAVSTTEIAAGAITATKLYIGDTSNIYPDPDMVDPAFYSLSSGATIGGTSTSITGEKRLILPVNAAQQTTYSGYFSVEPNKEYYFEIAINVGGDGGGSTGTAVAFLNQYSLDAAGGATYLVSAGSLTHTAGFVRVGFSFTTASTARRIRLGMRREAGGDAKCSFGLPILRQKSTGNLIVDGAITAEKIVANAVTTAKIATGAVTANEIATNAITAVKISAGAVVAGKIAANAVTANEIAANAVTTAKIATNAVTANEIAAGTITATELAANSVITAKIAAGAVSASQIAAGAILADKLAAGAVTASKLAVSASLQNLVINGDFEDDLNGWALTDAVKITPFATTSSSSGSSMMKMDRTVTNNTVSLNAMMQQYIPVSPGEVFEVKASFLGNAASSAGAYVRVLWYTSSKAAASPTYTDTYSNGAITTTLTSRVGQVTVPTGAKFARVQIYHHSTSTTQILYVDDVSMRRAAGATLIEDGAITTDKILAGSIVAEKLAVDSITVDKIKANEITVDKINSSAQQNIRNVFSRASFSSVGSTSWSVPSDVYFIKCKIWGGGGGGGYTSTGFGASSGGGSGGYVEHVFPVTPGQSITILVGGGGTGAWSSGNAQTGGTSSVTVGGVSASAYGGQGGGKPSDSTTSNPGQGGGYGTGLDFAINGSAGGLGTWQGNQPFGGNGGGAPLGGPSVPGGQGSPSSGAAPGGGGAGSVQPVSGGGNGAAGRVIIEW